MDEKELLRQLQKQRAGALEQAVAQYGAYVLAIIRNRSRGVLTPEDHEEIASDVFFALWNGAARIERGQLRPWLGAVARNRTAEAMRRQNVYLPLEDDTLITLDRLWEQMMEKEYQQFEITRENMDVIKTRRWTFFRCAITQWATGIWRCIISCRRFFEAASMEKREMPSSGR